MMQGSESKGSNVLITALENESPEVQKTAATPANNS